MKTTNGRLLAYVPGLINKELRLQSEYLAAVNRICGHACRPDCGCPIGKSTLAEIGKRVGWKALAQVASIACNRPGGRVQCRERLGGLLKYYSAA
jgi:hypothetical protein